MSVDLIISPDAETDIDDAKKWYGSVGLGVDLEFVRARVSRRSFVTLRSIA